MLNFVRSFLVVSSLLPTLLVEHACAQTKSIQIGLAKTFLDDQPAAFIEIATDDFKQAMKQATGFDGDVNGTHDAFALADKLDGKLFHFGVFHAHELAWVQKKHAQLQPLLIAANAKQAERAYLIVHKNNAAKSIADLRGKKLDLPAGTSEHCRLFLRKLASAAEAKDPVALFAAVVKSETRNDALDHVARGKVDATVVDAITLAFYKEVKGAVFDKNLRVLAESEVFPPAVIVYRQDTIDQKTLQQFRDGLLKAHTIREGRELMKTWNVDAFEGVPKDYDQRLAEIAKAYPPPSR
jgi:ABC-type phosphate/phosphonate transport system substrate-binding protein